MLPGSQFHIRAEFDLNGTTTIFLNGVPNDQYVAFHERHVFVRSLGGWWVVSQPIGVAQWLAGWLGLFVCVIRRYQPTPSSDSNAVVVKTMQSVGAVIESSQWFGSWCLTSSFDFLLYAQVLLCSSAGVIGLVVHYFFSQQ